MTTFNVTINAARTKSENGLSDILTSVEWTMTGTIDGTSFDLPGKTTMGPVDPENFTPYSQLTQQQVLDWVTAIEDAEGGQFAGFRAHIGMVVTRLAAEAALTTKDLPWAPAPEAPQGA